MKLSKEAFSIGVVITVVIGAAQWYHFKYHLPKREVMVYYNHDIQADDQIVQLIRQADKFVYFAVYTFTQADIRDALLGAKYRGLIVKGLVDHDQTKGLADQTKIINELRKAGIPIAEDNHQGIMHLKVIVTDKAYASGSYNWTSAATKVNDEVLEVGADAIIRRQYQDLLTKIFSQYAIISL